MFHYTHYFKFYKANYLILVTTNPNLKLQKNQFPSQIHPHEYLNI